MIETREKILDSAEKLFAEQGYAASSLRHIIADAGVNLAAIHYHFGSKEELLDEVILRRLRPVNEVRAEMLQRLEAEAGDSQVSLEKTLEAFLLPAADLAVQHPQWVRLMGRMHAEGLMPAFAQRHPLPVFTRFLDALKKALPHLSEEEFRWRIVFMFGAMAHSMAWPQRFAESRPDDLRRPLASLVSFLSGGFRAPATTPQEIGKQ
jgi:AcrR family transcriptional regulator